MNDLKNLKKAFILLDKENTGVISYDVKKLSECNYFLYFNWVVDNLNNLQIPDSGNEDQVFLNFDQFIEIMTNNIIKNRETFGRDKIVFESGKNKKYIIYIKICFRNIECWVYVMPLSKKRWIKNWSANRIPLTILNR